MNTDLWDEVCRSRIECAKRYRFIRHQITRYHGRGFLGVDGTPEPENVGYQFATHTVARLSSLRPRVTFSTMKAEAADRVEALEEFHKRWSRDTTWNRERERVILDMCFGPAVAMVVQRARVGFEQYADPINVPVALRLSPSLFGIDMDAASADEARFQFHRTIADRGRFLTECKNEYGWDLDACRRLVETSAAQARNQPEDPLGRKAIVYETIWCPYETLPDNAAGWGDMTKEERSRCHGVIYTYASDNGGIGMELREPMPYFGSRWGPYVVAGFMYVPDDPMYLGPLTANDGQIQQLNAQARANDLSAQRKKSIAVFNAQTPDAKAAILAAQDGDAIAVPGFESQSVAQMVLGGIDPESRAREMELRIRVDRGLALSDAARGEVTGVGTASENVIAAQAGENIANLWKRKVRDLDEGVALRVCWYADQDERTVLKTGPESIILGGNTPKMQLDSLKRAYANGVVDQEMYDGAAEVLGQMVEHDEPRAGGSFDDLEIEVEVLGDDASEAARMAQVDALVMNGPLIPQIALYTPGIKDYLKAKADMLALPWVADLFDTDKAAAVGAAMLQAEAPPPEPAKQAPRLKSQSPSGGASGRNPAQAPAAQATRLRQTGAKK